MYACCCQLTKHLTRHRRHWQLTWVRGDDIGGGKRSFTSIIPATVPMNRIMGLLSSYIISGWLGFLYSAYFEFFEFLFRCHMFMLQNS